MVEKSNTCFIFSQNNTVPKWLMSMIRSDVLHISSLIKSNNALILFNPKPSTCCSMQTPSDLTVYQIIVLAEEAEA